ncbi:MAG: SEC-C metal-binding domain-containing protein [Gemmataceae bacterium]
MKAGMAQFMSDRARTAPGQLEVQPRGLYLWAKERFPSAGERLKEDDFRTQSRQKLLEVLLDASKTAFPASAQELIDEQIDEVFEGSKRECDADDARELAAWVQKQFGVTVPEAELVGEPVEGVRSRLWTAYDQAFRPEMRQMERSLVLMQLDQSWKNHLYTMDHLRSGIGLVGYAQEDPKTVYKQEGMKEFRAMWEGVEDKITEMVFRMEETDAFQETIWNIGATVHETATSGLKAPPPPSDGSQEQGSTGETKKTDPIRNRGEKVGRNDPCPCGSGKKYKNCHMRQTV